MDFCFRYDSTALLIPESFTKSRTGAHDSILEEEDTAMDCPDTELEKSSDDILEMHCNNAQLSNFHFCFMFTTL